MNRLVAGVVAGLALAVVFAPTGAWAQPAPVSNADLAAKLDALAKKCEAQDQELQQLRTQVNSGSNLATMTDADRTLLAQMIKDEVAKSDTLKSALPSWLDGLTFTGNIRARYEGQFYNGFSGTKVNSGANGADRVTAKQAKNLMDFNRERIRLQFGFIKKFDDEWSAGFMLSTDDNTAKPWETNQTLTGDFSRKTIAVDQAWIQYRPACLNTKVDQVTLITGKFANPFVTTDMVWDADVRPEGLAESWVHKCSDEFSIFATLGQFFLKDDQFTAPGGASPTASPYGNTYLLAYQLGLRYKIAPDVALTLAAAYYQYMGVQTDPTLVAAGVTTGNSFNAGSSTHDTLANALDTNMHIVDIYSDLTFLVGPKKTPLKFYAQADWNVNDNAPTSFVSGGRTFGLPYHNQDQAYIFGVTYGKIKDKGDWDITYNYRWVEANAIYSAFSDSAFNGTDHQGHTLAFRYALLKNVTAGIRYVHYDWMIDKIDPGRDMIRAELQVNF
jgi:hypothetical protein